MRLSARKKVCFKLVAKAANGGQFRWVYRALSAARQLVESVHLAARALDKGEDFVSGHGVEVGPENAQRFGFGIGCHKTVTSQKTRQMLHQDSLSAKRFEASAYAQSRAQRWPKLR